MFKQATSPSPTRIKPNQPSLSNPQQTPKKGAGPKTKIGPLPKSKSVPPKKGQFKQDRVVALLRRAEGATVAAIMKATDWQRHSVHGFLAGVVRRKLGLNLTSEVKDDDRVYRIVEDKSRNPAASNRKRAA